MSCSAHPGGHLVRFFADETDCIETVTDFVCETLYANDTCVIIATPARRDAFRRRLSTMGIDCAALAARYQYIELDARTLLSQFMIGAECDHARFHRLLDTLIRQVSARGRPVRGYGEMCELLMLDGMPEAALTLEDYWNQVSSEYSITRLCGYSCAALAAVPEAARIAERIKLRHTHVL